MAPFSRSIPLGGASKIAVLGNNRSCHYARHWLGLLGCAPKSSPCAEGIVIVDGEAGPQDPFPDGVSAWGLHDLVGNGWEWSSTVFDGFPGFSPMPSYPEYSADFFDGLHYVIKGGSPATAPGLLRRSFRNWFRPHYPYVYACFRCVQG